LQNSSADVYFNPAHGNTTLICNSEAEALEEQGVTGIPGHGDSKAKVGPLVVIYVRPRVLNTTPKVAHSRTRAFSHGENKRERQSIPSSLFQLVARIISEGQPFLGKPLTCGGRLAMFIFGFP
jgi:hypothetical protein